MIIELFETFEMLPKARAKASHVGAFSGRGARGGMGGCRGWAANVLRNMIDSVESELRNVPTRTIVHKLALEYGKCGLRTCWLKWNPTQTTFDVPWTRDLNTYNLHTSMVIHVAMLAQPS